MRIGKHKLRLPESRQEWHHKLDHATHGTYVGAEAVFGHGVLQLIAIGMLVVVILGIVWHVEA